MNRLNKSIVSSGTEMKRVDGSCSEFESSYTEFFNEEFDEFKKIEVKSVSDQSTSSYRRLTTQRNTPYG